MGYAKPVKPKKPPKNHHEDASVLESYKSFITSQDLLHYVEWIQAVRNDDLTAFLSAYDPSDNPVGELFDPLEVVIAYGANTIFDYFLLHENYSHYYTPFNLSILTVCAIFKQDEFLHRMLAEWTFNDDDLIALYDYIIQYGSLSHFKEIYQQFPIQEDAHLDLLRLSLDHESIFYFLKAHTNYQTLIMHPDFIYDVVAFFPQFLSVIEAAEDLSFLSETDAFIRIFEFERFSDFKRTLDFCLKRGITAQSADDYGLKLIHLALRHAHEAKYVEYLVASGADTKALTTLGYPAAHQLILRDARFTLEVSHLIDFDQTDAAGKTLNDYDRIDYSEAFHEEDVIAMIRMIFNLDEKAIYELDVEEFYALSKLHGLKLFTPYITLAEFETIALKDAFTQRLYDTGLDAIDTEGLAQVFQTKFNHDTDKTIQIMSPIDLLDEYHAMFQSFADANNATFKLASEGYEINQLAQIEYTFKPHKPLEKRAVVYSHLVDVYFIHMFYDIPFDHIDYDPLISKNKRFLS